MSYLCGYYGRDSVKRTAVLRRLPAAGLACRVRLALRAGRGVDSDNVRTWSRDSSGTRDQGCCRSHQACGDCSSREHCREEGHFRRQRRSHRYQEEQHFENWAID